MVRFCAAKCLILSTAGRLVAHEVRVGAAKAGRADCLMGVDHHLVLCSLGHSIEIVVHHPLAVVRFASWEDVAYVTTLHCVIAVVIHQLVGLLHVPFIIADRR